MCDCCVSFLTATTSYCPHWLSHIGRVSLSLLALFHSRLLSRCEKVRLRHGTWHRLKRHYTYTASSRCFFRLLFLPLFMPLVLFRFYALPDSFLTCCGNCHHLRAAHLILLQDSSPYNNKSKQYDECN